MDDKTMQRKLNQLTKIANELHQEAKRRYGDEAQLFYECEGSFHVMSNDHGGCIHERQKEIKFSSEELCRMDCGAW